MIYSNLNLKLNFKQNSNLNSNLNFKLSSNLNYTLISMKI